MPINLFGSAISRMVALRLTRLAKVRKPEFKVRLSDGLVVLPRTADSAIEGDPGLYSLRFYERRLHGRAKATKRSSRNEASHATIGQIFGDKSGDLLRRDLISVESGDLKMARGAWLSGWLGTTPSHFASDIEIANIESSDGWTLPSWLQRATESPSKMSPSETWAIHIHGRGATPAETARNFQFFNALGFSNLSISYRNDASALQHGKVNLGPLSLGTSEWKDLEAAVQFAQSSGAKKLLIFAWSYGAALCSQFQRYSALASSISGYIYDSPVISWRATLAFQVLLAGRPPYWASWGEKFLANAASARSIGLAEAIHFEDFEVSSVARHLHTPMLILHSKDDGFVPFEPVQELATALPNLVRLQVFVDARHCRLYNFDRFSYQKAVGDFVKLVLR